MSLHHLASIHPDAKIGNNVTIEAFATIKSDVIIEDVPLLYQPVENICLVRK